MAEKTSFLAFRTTCAILRSYLHEIDLYLVEIAAYLHEIGKM